MQIEDTVSILVFHQPSCPIEASFPDLLDLFLLFMIGTFNADVGLICFLPMHLMDFVLFSIVLYCDILYCGLLWVPFFVDY